MYSRRSHHQPHSSGDGGTAAPATILTGFTTICQMGEGCHQPCHLTQGRLYTRSCVCMRVHACACRLSILARYARVRYTNMGADSPIVSPKAGKPTHEGWNLLHLMPAVALAVGHATFLYSQKDAIIAEFESTGAVSIPLSQPLSFAFCYILLVVLGSAYMRKSKVAYEPKEAMLVYNAYETVLSFAMLFFLVKEAAMNDGLGWHAPVRFTCTAARLACTARGCAQGVHHASV